MATPDTQPFWDGTAAGELRLQRCLSCDTFYFPPRPFCPTCLSDDVAWERVSGRGTLHSFSVIRRGQGAYAEATPYVLAYVELEEGPRVMTNLLVDPSNLDSLAIGQQVEMVIERADGVPPLLRFRLA